MRTMFEPVEFSSEGMTLRGRLYRSFEQPSPAVVMAHGTSAVVPMMLDRYAEVFQRAGLSVLLYDHLGLGRSDGERQIVNPWVQARGYRDAISFCEQLGVSPVAVWGVSYSAVEALVVAAVDDRVAAVTAHVPTFGELPGPPDLDGGLFEALRRRLLDGDVHGSDADRNGPMPVVSDDQVETPPLLPQRTAFDWFHGAGDADGWVNEVTLVEPEFEAPWHGGLAMPHVQCPLLMSFSDEDEVGPANPKVTRAAFDAVPGPKTLLETGGSHFAAFWYPSEAFDAISGSQADFLVRVLVKKEMA
jgi:pimeloyl-ACP methyl ester carboxylesterase